MTGAAVRARLLRMSAPPQVARILIVANRTSSTPVLLDEVGRRRHEASFTLMVPPVHAGHDDWTPEEASQLLERAAAHDIATLDCGADALDTVHEAVGDGDFDEIILCTPEEHLSKLMHHDLARRLRRLGLPVVVIPPESDGSLSEVLQNGLPGTYRQGLN